MAHSERRLKVLLLDGCGGVPEFSSILVVDQIMHDIRDNLGLPTVPRPCDYFDFIGGCGTGGLIAILLGRLGLTVDECYEYYYDLARNGFKPVRSSETLWGLTIGSRGALSPEDLENALVEIVEKHNALWPERVYSHSTSYFVEDDVCKTVVLASRKDDRSDESTLFRTYSQDPAIGDCKIWEVGRASSAFKGLYNPAKCGTNQVKFTAASSGAWATLLSEVTRIFPGREVGCVLRVGTHPSRIKRPLKIHVPKGARLAEPQEQQMKPEWKSFQFGCIFTPQDIEFSDMTKWATCRSQTISYIEANRDNIRACSLELSGPVQNDGDDSENLFHVPYSLWREDGFFGRQSILSELEARFRSYKEVALTGLAGNGKSRIAMEYCKRRRTQKIVFWIDANTAVKLNEGLRALDFFTSKLPRHSGARHRSCLIVLNDVVDPQAISESDLFSPRHESSLYKSLEISILITCQDRKIAHQLTSIRATISVGPLEEAAAIGLLHHSLDSQHQPTHESATLVHKLACSPLAISAVASYISIGTTTIHECVTAIEQEQQLPKLLDLDLKDWASRNPHKPSLRSLFSTNIATLPPESMELLSLLSVLDGDAIPMSLLCMDSMELFLVLKPLIDLHFATSHDNSIHIHRLIQTCTRELLIQRASLHVFTEKGFQLVLAALSVESDQITTKCPSLVKNAFTLLSYHRGEDTEKAQVLSKISHCLRLMGDLQKAEATGLEAFKLALASPLDEDKKPVLEESFQNLVLSLLFHGKHSMIEQAYMCMASILGNDYKEVERLDNFALIELAHGNVDSAARIANHAYGMSSTRLGQDHPVTLRIMDRLALIYWHLEQAEHAREWCERALDICHRSFGRNDLATSLQFELRLASVLILQGHSKAAADHIFRAADIGDRFLVQPPAYARSVQCSLLAGEALEHLRKIEAAEIAIGDAWHVSSNRLSSLHPLSLRSGLLLIRILNKQCKHQDAEDVSMQILPQFRRLFRDYCLTCSKRSLEFDVSPKLADSGELHPLSCVSIFKLRPSPKDPSTCKPCVVDPISTMTSFWALESFNELLMNQKTALESRQVGDREELETGIQSNLTQDLYRLPESDHESMAGPGVAHTPKPELQGCTGSKRPLDQLKTSSASNQKEIGEPGPKDGRNVPSLATNQSATFDALDLAHVTDAPGWTYESTTVISALTLGSSLLGTTAYNAYLTRAKEQRECEEAERKRRADDAASYEAGHGSRWGYRTLHDPLHCDHSWLHHPRNSRMERGPRKPIQISGSVPRELSTDQNPEREIASGNQSANTGSRGAPPANEHSRPLRTPSPDIHALNENGGTVVISHDSGDESSTALDNGAEQNTPRDSVQCHTPQHGPVDDMAQSDETVDPKDSGGAIVNKLGKGPQPRITADDEGLTSDSRGDGGLAKPPATNDNGSTEISDSHENELAESSQLEQLSPSLGESNASITGAEYLSTYSQEEHTQHQSSSYQMKAIATTFSIILPRCPEQKDLRQNWHMHCSRALDAAVDGEDRAEAAWKALKLGEPSLQNGYQLKPVPTDPKGRNDWYRRYLAVFSGVVNGQKWSDVEEREFDCKGDNHGDGAGNSHDGPDNDSHERWIPVEDEAMPY